MSKTNSLYMQKDEEIIDEIMSISKEVRSQEEYFTRARALKKYLTCYDDMDAEQEIEMIWIISNEENRQCQ